MRAAAAFFAVCAACVGSAPCSAATIKPEPFGCSSFMKDFPADAAGYRLSFERPLTISRGFGDIVSGVEVHVLSSGTEVDGTLKCRGDAFLRFEMRATLPAKDKTLTDFSNLAQAALMATFRWDHGKAQTVERAMAQDAGEYLQASLQRGDLYNSGKVEYHQADRLDLGLLWTQTDRTFVISSQDGE